MQGRLPVQKQCDGGPGYDGLDDVVGGQDGPDHEHDEDRHLRRDPGVDVVVLTEPDHVGHHGQCGEAQHTGRDDPTPEARRKSGGYHPQQADERKGADPGHAARRALPLQADEKTEPDRDSNLMKERQGHAERYAVDGMKESTAP